MTDANDGGADHVAAKAPSPPCPPMMTRCPLPPRRRRCPPPPSYGGGRVRGGPAVLLWLPSSAAYRRRRRYYYAPKEQARRHHDHDGIFEVRFEMCAPSGDRRRRWPRRRRRCCLPPPPTRDTRSTGTPPRTDRDDDTPADVTMGAVGLRFSPGPNMTASRPRHAFTQELRQAGRVCVSTRTAGLLPPPQPRLYPATATRVEGTRNSQ